MGAVVTLAKATINGLLALARADPSGDTRERMCLRATTALILCSTNDGLGFLGMTTHWLTARSTSTKRDRISYNKNKNKNYNNKISHIAFSGPNQ